MARKRPDAAALDRAMARLVEPLEAVFSKVGCGPPVGGGYEVLSAREAAKVGDGWHAAGARILERVDLDWHAPYLVDGISASVDDARRLEALPDSVMESVIMAQSHYLRTAMDVARHEWVGIRWTNPDDGSSVEVASRIEFWSDADDTVDPEATVRTEMSFNASTVAGMPKANDDDSVRGISDGMIRGQMESLQGLFGEVAVTVGAIPGVTVKDRRRITAVLLKSQKAFDEFSTSPQWTGIAMFRAFLDRLSTDFVELLQLSDKYVGDVEGSPPDGADECDPLSREHRVGAVQAILRMRMKLEMATDDLESQWRVR